MRRIGLSILAAALIGTAGSTVFLVLSLLGAAKFHRHAAKQRRDANAARDNLPPVSLLKTIHNLEPQLEENLESFFTQDYPNFEILFAVDDEHDAALPIAQALCRKYPHIPTQVLITGKAPWPNPVASSLFHMAKAAHHEILVTSDSDVLVSRDYLLAVVAPFLDSRVAMVTCLYRGLSAGGFWSLIDALGMSVEMTAGVLVANLLEGMKFGLGPTIVVRKQALHDVGGYELLAQYGPNDFVIGNLLAGLGQTVLLSGYVISHVAPPMTFQKMWQRHVRWAIGTRYSRPKGHLGTGLVFSVPYGILGLAGAMLLQMPVLGASLFAWSIANRIIEALVIGWGVTRDPECLRKPWLYPLRDLLGFAVWTASYLDRNFRWRAGDFQFSKGARIIQTSSATAVP